MSKDTQKKQDPFKLREQAKYANPVPSREFIMDHLEQRACLMSYEELAEDLDLYEEDEIEAIRRRMQAMVRDGQLHRNRKGCYGLISKMDLIAGRVRGHREGYGTVIPDKGSEIYSLPERQMRGVFGGDRVLVRLVEGSRRGRKGGRKECQIIRVIESNTEQIVGRFYLSDGIAHVIPDSKTINQEILIPEGERGDAQAGQIVTAQIITQPSMRNLPVGRVVEVLGEHMAPGLEIDIALRAHGIPYQWPDEAISEARALPTRVENHDKQDRVDLRELPFVTIDGEDAKDFDDAVYCEPLKNGYHVYVAIADVDHYVKPGSALDEQAQVRGTSVYFPGRVIPMLPTQLSNGLCSLKPRVDRLAMVCKISLTSKGKVRKFEFFEGVIRSHARLTYEKVAKMIEQKDKRLRDQYKELLPHLQRLYEVFYILHDKRASRGAIDFEIPETKIVFGSDKKISKIVPQHRVDSHRLIEECMLLANVCAAELLLKQKIQTLYRVHGGPEAEKIVTLRQFLKQLGLKLTGGKKPSPSDYKKILEKTMDRPDGLVIQTMLLRSMGAAHYQNNNIGHFGLAYDAYCHFTSPIRRYPDLLVHRAIKHIVRGNKPKKFMYDAEKMVHFGEHCSAAERRADDATRDVVDWLKCEFMSDKVGQEFSGKISGVTPFGLFVTLHEVFVDGLLHITGLGNDYYHYDEVAQRLVGERTNATFTMGDELDILVARVSLDDRMIDFELVGVEKATTKPKKKRYKKKKS